MCDSVCLSVCLHDKTKTAVNTIANFGTQLVHRDTSPINEYYVKVKVTESQSVKVDRVAGVSYALCLFSIIIIFLNPRINEKSIVH